MKHGDKAKAKAAKASVKKTSKTGSAPEKSKGAKAAKAIKSVKAVKAAKAVSVKGSKTGSKPAAAKAPARHDSGPRPKTGGDGHPAIDVAAFSNPAVATAFKRAVKKYPNAFRRLTD